ncbi:MAG: CBS domain-containing protein [Planctomycetes bacterium]|nr:CBS domain-containing protein [Planctomycetota bacterium]
MLVGAIMSRRPVTVQRDHTVLRVARLMREEDVGAVVVVDARGRPVGICTDRDLAIRALAGAGGDPGAMPVDRVMSRPVVTADEETLLFDLLRTMAEKRIRRAPVVDGEKSVIGMVSMDDIILLLTTELANVAEVLGHSSRVLGERAPEEE